MKLYGICAWFEVTQPTLGLERTPAKRIYIHFSLA
jgi:hypothetical protein